MDIPTLTSDRLALHSFDGRHMTPTYVSWLNDPAVVRYSEQRHHKHTMESCRDYAASFASSDNSFIAIETHQFGHIGNMTVTRDIANGIADLSIMIGHRDCWGQGLATEAWTMAMRHLFQSEKLRKITAGTMSENRAMLSLMQRSRMDIEGRRARHFLLDGQEVDLVMAAAFATPWLGQQT